MSQAKQDEVRDRVLQYVADTTIVGAEGSRWIDEWLLKNGANSYDVETASATVAGIELHATPQGNGGATVGVKIRPVDAGAAQKRLRELGIEVDVRRSTFVYAEEWTNSGAATEDANQRLANYEAPAAATEENTKGKVKTPSTEVQNQVLRHLADTLRWSDRRHWLVIDTWLMERAAIDAKDGHGQRGGGGPTNWSALEAEFEIDGVWLRIEHRRDDERHSSKDATSIDLLGELRILEPMAAKARLRERGYLRP